MATKKKARKKQRRRTSHPGVKLLTRPDTGTWIARWTDPLSGKVAQQSMVAIGARSEEARVAWARDKSRSIKQTAAAVASGTAVAEPKSVAGVIASYLKASTAKPTTLASYKPSLMRFQEWAATEGIEQMQDLRPHHLARFRDYVVKLPRLTSKAGGKRGTKADSDKPRSRVTTNTTFALVKMLLRWARLRGYLPHVDSDRAQAAFAPLKVDRDAIEFVRPPELKKLLQAAQRHDRATFELTRAEHGGLRKAGTTPRYEPCAPFVLLAVLTGMRRGELIGLEWDEVDLHDEEIRLPARRVKTKMARTISLTESPTAIALLRALRVKTRGERVFPAWSDDVAVSTRARLLAEFKAPAFTWQMLRRSCSAILTNAPAIYGAASAFNSAKRCGHSVEIAERNYAGLLKGLPRNATTIEVVAGIEEECNAIVRAVGGAVVGAKGVAV